MSRTRLWTASQLVLTLILLGVVALWAESYRTYHHLSKGGPSATGFVLTSFQGALVFQRRTGWEYDKSFFWQNHRPAFRIDEPGAKHHTLFGCGLWTGTQYVWPGHLYPAVTPLPPQTDPRWQKNRYTAIVIPYWLIALVLTAAQVHLNVAQRRKRFIERIARGLCPHSGYDLRATPAQCPECGAKALHTSFLAFASCLRAFLVKTSHFTGTNVTHTGVGTLTTCPVGLNLPLSWSILNTATVLES